MRATLIGMMLCVNPVFADKLVLVNRAPESGGVPLYRARYFVELDSLKTVRNWNPEEGAPVPVTRDQAVKLAKEEAFAMGQKNFEEEKLSVVLQKAGPFYTEGGEEIRVPKNLCFWYYEVNFGGAGGAPESQYVVSMDGKVAIRMITR